jgi:hypothetical protein
MEKQKIVIGYPYGSGVSGDTTQSLLYLWKFELENPDERYEVLDIHGHQGLYIQENRNALVAYAKEMGADWLLMVDGDIAFPNVALRILMRSADPVTRPIVSALYTNVGNITDGSFEILDCVYREAEDGKYQTIIPPDNMQPFEVDAVGFGFVLVHMSVYDSMEYPQFFVTHFVNEDGSRQIVNEDLGWCRVAREKGFHIYVDHLVDLTHWKTIPLITSQFKKIYKEAKLQKDKMDKKRLKEMANAN